MGAGVSSLSKICLVEPSENADADVDYTFVGIGIERDEVDFAGNCGNMSAAIGPYAFNERLLGDKYYDAEEEVTVRILNTNTGRLIRSTFAVANGEARVDDLTAIDGVSGLGTGVLLDFVRPGGSKTGKLLPTGNVVDMLAGIEASCVDAANPCVFVRAKDVGIEPTILPTELSNQAEKLALLEEIRAAGARAMGICKAGEEPPRVIPKVAIVSPSVDQVVLSGESIPASKLDLVVRFISDTQPHRAIPLTGALCTAAAAKIPGSIVQQCLGDTLVEQDLITIGHPSGKVQVNAKVDEQGEIESCRVVRTARRLMVGLVYWSDLEGMD
jgi:2-methylaconitate cis-trans-isomerase PrpF